MRIGRLLLVLVSPFAALLVPNGVLRAQAGQGRPCEVVITGVERGSDTTRFTSVMTATGARHMFVGGGVDAACAGQGNRLLADSAEHYADRGLLILFDNVRYTEPTMQLTSNRMYYYTNEERLVAEGDVKAKTSTGTRFEGPRIEYFRAKPGQRAAPRWVATGRPFVRMSPAETGAPPVAPDAPAPAAPRPGGTPAPAADSVDLTANIVISENDSLMWASGDVIIERVDIRATADSATLDNGIGFARLLEDPLIVGRGERPFTLDGVVIDLWSRERQLERVLSSGEAEVVSDSLTLTADTIDLRFADQRMERVFTWGGRSRADAPAQRIDADSLDIIMPGQRLREVRAVGGALASSVADTALVITDERDWIRGDTIVALFDTTGAAAAVADTTTSSQPAMREVVATGAARAFYQMSASDSAKALPNISYNRGRIIKVSFVEGAAERVDVIDRASGIYLEPIKTDTTTRRP